MKSFTRRSRKPLFKQLGNFLIVVRGPNVGPFFNSLPSGYVHTFCVRRTPSLRLDLEFDPSPGCRSHWRSFASCPRFDRRLSPGASSAQVDARCSG